MPDAAHSPWQAADIRRLRILSSRLVTGNFAGNYRSAFRGRGIEFEEVREYQPGDDIRCIDWNVTARYGHPFIKRFVEERELSVMLLLDQSPSLAWAKTPRGKSRVAAEICALLAFAAARSHDHIGLLAFSDRIERYLPPAKGLRHAQHLIAEALKPPQGSGTDLAGALDYLNRVRRSNGVLILLSDFICGDFRLPLLAAARRHDVVAISLTNALDADLPDLGLIRLTDPETGSSRLVDSGDAGVRSAYRALESARLAELESNFAAAGATHLVIANHESPLRALTRLFQSRARRQSR